MIHRRDRVSNGLVAISDIASLKHNASVPADPLAYLRNSRIFAWSVSHYLILTQLSFCEMLLDQNHMIISQHVLTIDHLWLLYEALLKFSSTANRRMVECRLDIIFFPQYYTVIHIIFSQTDCHSTTCSMLFFISTICRWTCSGDFSVCKI